MRSRAGWGLTGVVFVAVLATVSDLFWALGDAWPVPAEELGVLVMGIGGGWSFVVSGLIVRRNRTGVLMVVAGLLILLSGVNFVGSWLTLLVGNTLGWLALAVLAHAVLVAPDGKGRRAAVLGVYAGMAVGLVVWLRFGRLGDGSCVCLPVLPGGEHLAGPLTAAVAVAFWVSGPAMTASLVWRWLVRLPGPRRRTFAPVALAGAALLLVTWTRQGLYVWLGAEAAQSAAHEVLHLMELVSMLLWPLGVLAGMVRARLDQAAVAQLATRADPSPATLEVSLATVLRDPALRLVFRAADGGYADAAGRPVGPPSGARLELGGVRDAVLLHDPALDPEPVRSAAAIARLVLDNEHMRGELAAQLAEVRASRARIVAAGDAERHRIERNLHDGAQQRLATLATLVGRARLRNTDAELAGLLDEAAQTTRAALAELRELAGGIHPAVLSQSGLGAALRSLAERSPVPATVTEELAGRLPAAVEQAAYFVAAEALANVAKHAGASHVSIVATVTGAGSAIGPEPRTGPVLRMVIRDDGVGGAREEAGTGLRGLADRVAALDGARWIHSPPGQGTTVTVEIPTSDYERK
ncbi:sensor histidine kinase [Nonomuraea purpurea]|uniref:histidine kinase n=1 Tax=Nonomuraea purpurea TaxID=1849276 RepID=A0ABV8GFP6_9ACTN